METEGPDAAPTPTPPPTPAEAATALAQIGATQASVNEKLRTPIWHFPALASCTGVMVGSFAAPSGIRNATFVAVAVALLVLIRLQVLGWKGISPSFRWGFNRNTIITVSAQVLVGASIILGVWFGSTHEGSPWCWAVGLTVFVVTWLVTATLSTLASRPNQPIAS
ncbi:MAG: hypothetical protein LBO75_02790 [Bifidobacteriaceae bacterium]|jgi:hypothetical protein|nr:hypothetical protein [Bifidobacteriaceae bacterium]